MIKTHHRRLEDHLRMEVAELTQALQETETARGRLEADLDRRALEYLHVSRKGMTPEEAESFYTTMDALTASAARIRQQESLLKKQWEHKQAELLEAARDKKTLELLETRRRQEQRLRQERRAQHLLDDAAGRRKRSSE